MVKNSLIIHFQKIDKKLFNGCQKIETLQNTCFNKYKYLTVTYIFSQMFFRNEQSIFLGQCV